MAMLTNMAMLDSTAKPSVPSTGLMGSSKVRPSEEMRAGARAERVVSELFTEAGWQIQRSTHPSATPAPDLVVERGDYSYSVEVKAASEGRSDRLVPLWSQAWLQAARVSGK